MSYRGSKDVPPRTAAVLLLFALLLDIPCLATNVVIPHKLPSGPKHKIHRQIEVLEGQWRQAVLANDVNAMDHLLADDYTAITASGMIQTKAQFLSTYQEAKYQILSLDISDRKIRVYGNTAVVTSRADVTIKKDQEETKGQFRYTRVYNRNSAGQWKIVSFEINRIRDPNDREAH
jgi:uncharacterized protein (TIGR02246 family)